MPSDERKVVLVVCADRAMQDALAAVVEAAGCRVARAATPAAAETRAQRTLPVLALVDPGLTGACASLAERCPLVEIPVRVSANGVRRIAKRNDAAVKWLRELVAARCAAAGG